MFKPFAPSVPISGGSTVNLAATTASSNVAVIASSNTGPTAPIQVRIYNAGSATVFIRPGNDSGVVASTAVDMPVPAGAIEVITVWNRQGVYIAAITSSGTAQVYFTPGDGG